MAKPSCGTSGNSWESADDGVGPPGRAGRARLAPLITHERKGQAQLRGVIGVPTTFVVGRDRFAVACGVGPRDRGSPPPTSMEAGVSGSEWPEDIVTSQQ